MPPLRNGALLLPVLLGLGACYYPEPQRESRVIIQQPAPQQALVMSPAPPPPPHSELVPPPPQGTGPVVWQPGHWMYTGVAGSEWAWQPGQYRPPPIGQTTWVPGHWAQQPTGGWSWMEGHSA
jgi:WXXGXW repeat (2 copies)